MKNNKRNPAENPPSLHRFLHFYRNRVMNLFILAVILLYFVYSMSCAIPQEISRCYELLDVNVEQVERYEEYAGEANKLYYDVQDQRSLSIGRLYLASTADGFSIPEIVNNLNEDSKANSSFFYQYKSGTVLSSDSRSALTLTDSEKAQLFADGVYQNSSDSLRYYAIEKGDGHLIIRINEAKADQFSLNMLELTSLDGFIYNNETLDIIDADEKTIPSSLLSMYVGQPLENDQFRDSGIEIKLISPYSTGLGRYTHMKLAAVAALSGTHNGCSFVAYIPLTQIAGNILIKSGLRHC